MLAAASDVTFAAGTELSLRVSLSKKFLRRCDEEPTRRWGEGSYGKSCFKAVSERGRCWQLILVRAEGGKKACEVSQVLCGERHWRSTNPVALSPSRFTPRSQFVEFRLERALQSNTEKRR
jgi:hypothetical protein